MSTSEALEAGRAAFDRGQWGAAFAHLAAVDSHERLPQIMLPTLVLAGGADILTHPALVREVAELIPGAEFRLLDGEAHQPFQERPDEWNAIVHHFWSRVDA